MPSSYFWYRPQVSLKGKAEQELLNNFMRPYHAMHPPAHSHADVTVCVKTPRFKILTSHFFMHRK